MSAFLNTTLAVPTIQIVLLLLLSTLALLFGKTKLALIINYIFTLYWAYFFNRDRLVGYGLEKFDHITMIYFLFGLGIVLVASLAFMLRDD